MPAPREIIERHAQRYARPITAAAAALEQEVIGAGFGANGYTTLAQANLLLDRLALRPHSLLLDVGSGRGWPALHLASRSGCAAVLSDVPETALRAARRTADRLRLSARVAMILASGALLPFRPRAFDAAVHTDTL